MSSFEVMNEIQGKIILGAYIALALWTAEQRVVMMPLCIHINGKHENVKVVDYITAAVMALQYANEFWGTQAYVFDIKVWLLIIDT